MRHREVGARVVDRPTSRYDRSMPDSEAVRGWIRRNEAARAEDRRRDQERSMSERLEEAVRLSRVAAELAEFQSAPRR